MIILNFGYQKKKKSIIPYIHPDKSLEIIEKIKASNSYYPLTPKEILKLNQQGLSGEVLEHMHASHEAKVQNNVAEEINKREQQKLEAVEKLKREQQSCRAYDRFYPGFGWGGGFGRPYGWW